MRFVLVSLLIFTAVVCVGVWLHLSNKPKPSVLVESVNEFSQIFYVDEKGQKKQLTEGYKNHFQPDASGNFMVWIEEDLDTGVQNIVLFNKSTQEKKSISKEEISTNQQPVVDEKGRVVWQGWVDETWQVFYFDGQNSKQLTQGDTAQSPHFNREAIEFLRRSSEGEWRSEAYSLKDESIMVLKTGDEAKADYLVK